MPERAGYGPRATPFKLKSLYTKDRRLNRTLCDRDVDMTIPGHPPAEERALPRTVAMFRQPRQRVISAYRNGKHCDGFQEVDKDPNWKHLTVAEYARHAGASRRLVFRERFGSQRRRFEKMAAGKTTERFRGRHPRLHDAHAPRRQVRARAPRDARLRQRQGRRERPAPRVRGHPRAMAREHLYVVVFPGNFRRFFRLGLFHKMHGGRPSAVEFGITHSTRGDLAKKAGLHEAPKPYDESVLEGVEDPDEDAVYAAALDVFDRQLRRHAPNCPRR